MKKDLDLEMWRLRRDNAKLKEKLCKVCKYYYVDCVFKWCEECEKAECPCRDCRNGEGWELDDE